MTKYLQAVLVILGLILSINNVRADELIKSTSTQVDNPDSSSTSSTTTTREDNPTTVKQESSYSESSPGGEKQVNTTRKYTVPRHQRTTTKHTETNVTR